MTTPVEFQTPQADVAGQARTHFLNSVLTGLRADQANGFAPNPTTAAGSDPTPSPCACQECHSAVGPVAYLADLLEYALLHVQNKAAPINLQFLTATFCQPFGDLPAACHSLGDSLVRQVRLCTEVLRGYLKANPPTSDQQSALTGAEKAYRLAAYTTLLIQLGTSYDEIRAARALSTDKRQALADRLGIDLVSPSGSDLLNGLLFDPNAITEPALEKLFGLVDTTRNPLTPAATPDFQTWRLQHLHTLWWNQDWPAAPSGAPSLPFIDPDLIGPGDLKDPSAGHLAFDLWQARRTWVDGQLAALKAAREAKPKAADGFDAILKSALGKTAADLAALAATSAQGTDITPQLDQLHLSRDAFLYLLRIGSLIAANTPVLDSEWTDVYSILTQTQKRRQFASWQADEKTKQIILSPDFFVLVDPALSGSDTLSAWRANAADRRAWQDTLQARSDQALDVGNALQDALGKTEEATLPLLRDALVQATAAPGTDLAGKADWITDHLLIDARTGAAQQTTRIGQAIETVQRLIEGLRAGLLGDAYPALSLAADNFDEEWQWLGSYSAWRAALFVFLYPENLLLPSLRRWQTPEFRALIAALRATRSVSPETARAAAGAYAEYYHAVCSLALQASCTANTLLESGDRRPLLYLFALGGTPKTVYWSAYDPADGSGYAQTFWDAVPGSDKAVAVLGAVPYEISSTERYVYLFLQGKDKPRLAYLRYDLERRSWDTEATELELPTSTGTYVVFVVQRLGAADPPAFFLWGPGGKYVRGLNQQGTGWETRDQDSQSSDDWTPFRIPGYTAGNVRVRAVFRTTNQATGAYWTCFETADGHLHVIAETSYPAAPKVAFAQDLGAYAFSGGFPGTLSDELFIFSTPRGGTGTFYQRVFANTLGKQQSAGTGLQQVVPDFGTVTGGQRFFAYSQSGTTGQGNYRCSFAVNSGPGTLTLEGAARVAPLVPLGPFDIPDHPKDQQFPAPILAVPRQQQIRSAFEANAGGPASNLTYLAEAYYFVPVYLALQLQAGGQYTTALDWLRTVYDYRQPVTERKIYYGLTLEEGPDSGYQRAADWLLDPLNPHAIATTRTLAYTRFTLLTLIGCLLDFADAEFTRDTSESLPRARALYMTALDLLGLPEMNQHLGQCDQVIGTLDIMITDPQWKPAGRSLQRSLARLRAADTVKQVTQGVRQVLAGTGAWEARFSRAFALVAQAQAAQPRPPTLATLLTQKTETLGKARAALLAHPGVAAAVEQVATAAGTSFLLRAGAGAQANHTAPASRAGANPAPPVSAPALHFCIPPNPVLKAVRFRAELNLFKLRNGQNIAGMQRPLDSSLAPPDDTSGLPAIGAGGQLVLPGATVMRPTPYRYSVLIERAKQLVQLAAQMEAAMLAALEKRDAEAYNLLKARQDVQLTRAGVRLQDLRFQESQDGVKLAELQQARAQLQVNHFQELLDTPVTELEAAALFAMGIAYGLQVGAAAASFVNLAAAMGALAGAANTAATMLTTLASYERRQQEWAFERDLAQQDVRIGAQQVKIATDGVRVSGQERAIAQLQADHAEAVVDFLSNKFTNAELYDWMSGVLERVYAYFLGQATAMAQLAANQLAFERQQVPPPFIQADYWEAPTEEGGGAPGDGQAADRRGLTGSARLLQDIFQLDQYAFDTNQRKLQLTKTLSLAQLAPAEFQRFRETGVLTFATPMDLFDRDFPGHYLRLIRRARVSVVALIPPTQGIRATLSTPGLSRVVIGNGGLFQPIVVRRDPESVALSSPRDATGLFELDQQPEMLLPFEETGVDTVWEFRMPKAANLFDYDTLADVLLTLDYTALDSSVYRQQVLQQLDPHVSADRAFSFRQQFADAWYDLNNPAQSATPMAVHFTTRREDFAPNREDVRIQQVVLYFARTTGATFEVTVTGLLFNETGSKGPVGGGAQSVGGVISTRQANGSTWATSGIIGKSPVGDWQLTLADDVKDHFKNEEIDDILFVLTYTSQTPAWPVA
jgi:hypothetical protein